MKFYEILYYLAFPLLPAFNNKVKKDINKICKKINSKIDIIDIGGRLSPYTIGLDGEVIIIDKEPISFTQRNLHLGLDEKKIIDIKKKRSNIKNIILHDMIEPLENMSNSFDVALSIEVIEHVKEAECFIKNITNLLKPDGVLYLTTPNGDYIKNEPPHYNPDHIKHYTKIELHNMLNKFYNHVSIEYGIKTGKNRMRSLSNWEFNNPLILLVWFSSIISRIESMGLENTSNRTAHLFATCREKKI